MWKINHCVLNKLLYLVSRKIAQYFQYCFQTILPEAFDLFIELSYVGQSKSNFDFLFLFLIFCTIMTVCHMFLSSQEECFCWSIGPGTSVCRGVCLSMANFFFWSKPSSLSCFTAKDLSWFIAIASWSNSKDRKIILVSYYTLTYSLWISTPLSLIFHSVTQ